MFDHESIWYRTTLPADSSPPITWPANPESDPRSSKNDPERISVARHFGGHTPEALANSGRGAPPGIYEDELRIGQYRILQVLSSGGMGEVFLATRDYEGFQKRVALKVLKPVAGDDAELRWRFRKETQILAALDHPNIAKFYDAGTTEGGLPYIALELVEGETIDRYCEKYDLSLVERIQLFQTICSAVHAAHQNLVVHRDLKPANILVVPRDGPKGRRQGIPKLLDFGIAKLLNPELTSPRIRAMVHPLLTPAYASPEQIRGEWVTTATDVYSLGVLLYELLTGQRPYPITGRTLVELEQEICKQIPLEPSKAALRSHESTIPRATVSPPVEKGSGHKALARRLAGDLDSIVLKALHKEPARRYASVLELSEDLERFLEKQPVSARPNTLLYRGRRFLQRHSWASTGLLLFLSLTLMLLLDTRVTLVTAQELNGIAIDERDAAQARAEQSAGEARYLKGLVIEFMTQYPNGAFTQFLGWVMERFQRDLADQPKALANMLETAGLVYQSMGQYERAITYFQEALALRESLDPSRAETAQTLLYLANAQLLKAARMETRNLVREAQKLEEKSHQLVERAQELRQSIAANELEGYATILIESAALFHKQGHLDLGEVLLLEAISILREGEGSAMLACAVHQLATIQEAEGDLESAKANYREALKLREPLGQRHPKRAETIGRLAALLVTEGETAEAEALAREALGILVGKFHDDDWLLAIVQGALGEAMFANGYDQEAEGLLNGRVLGVEVLLRESYELLSRGDSQDPRFAATLPRARERLCALYRAWDYPEGAGELCPAVEG